MKQHSVRNIPRRTSCGKTFSQYFDLSLVVIDTVHFIINRIGGTGIPASHFRIVRLLRVARILRLLRATVFRDLLNMIQGMVGGLGTLCWSLALFVLFIYVVALVFKELLGPQDKNFDDTMASWYFRSVPRSMYSIFRCSFGDCSTAEGEPMAEIIVAGSGGIWLSFLYSGFTFIVMIGIFNVISAIFVESALATASELAAEKRRKRLEDPQRWAVNFMKLLRALLSRAPPGDGEFLLQALSNGKLTEPLLNKLQKVEIARGIFDEVLETDRHVQQALQELDIQKADHRYLSDILDPDNSGSIGVLELLDGIQRLRGEPRRSDIIAVDLMVRSIQEKIDELWHSTHHPKGDVAETEFSPFHVSTV